MTNAGPEGTSAGGVIIGATAGGGFWFANAFARAVAIAAARFVRQAKARAQTATSIQTAVIISMMNI
jgi:hypothetical protein